MTSAMPVQRSTNRGMKPLSWEQVNLLGSFVPVKDAMNDLTNRVFSVRTVSYGSSFFPVDLWPAYFALGP